MSMHPVAWWPTLTLLAIATVVDIHSRRIPNWLVLLFLAAGVMANTGSYGMKGMGQSMLRGMGMGDLELCAAGGGWIGPGQLCMALVATGIAGGVLALIWAACHGSLGASLEGASDLVSAFWTKGVHPHPSLVLDNPAARAMPYAPAIAIGTLFSSFAV
jgi:prepilin peptidase CpaA